MGHDRDMMSIMAGDTFFSVPELTLLSTAMLAWSAARSLASASWLAEACEAAFSCFEMPSRGRRFHVRLFSEELMWLHRTALALSCTEKSRAW